MSEHAYFVRTGEQRFRPTGHTGGAWADDEQHVAPTFGIVVHALETLLPGPLVLSRLTAEILAPPPIAEFDVAVEVVRRGRTIELSEVTLTYGGRVGVRARAWRLLPGDSQPVAGGVPRSIPGPDALEAWDMTSVWPGGFIASLDVRRSPDAEPGRYQAWASTPVPLVAQEPVSDLARWVGLLDTANGISVREDPRRWMFPNVDLTLHLHRQPEGPWVGFDTQVTFGPGGLGVTDSVVHDVLGPVGRVAQSLTVRPLG